jgi:predicted Zn-dependent protease
MGDEIKNLKRGAEMLERCVKLNDKHPTAWKVLGNAYRSLNKRKDASRAYKMHLEVSPADEENELVRDFVKELGG